MLSWHPPDGEEWIDSAALTPRSDDDDKDQWDVEADFEEDEEYEDDEEDEEEDEEYDEDEEWDEFEEEFDETDEHEPRHRPPRDF